ncbi:hypothetical protein QTP88_023580 [Uroleucon formosanum]
MTTIDEIVIKLIYCHKLLEEEPPGGASQYAAIVVLTSSRVSIETDNSKRYVDVAVSDHADRWCVYRLIYNKNVGRHKPIAIYGNTNVLVLNVDTRLQFSKRQSLRPSRAHECGHQLGTVFPSFEPHNNHRVCPQTYRTGILLPRLPVREFITEQRPDEILYESD